MGICLGWTQSVDITPQAWARIREDFQTLADPYQVELTARREQFHANSSFLVGLLQPRPPTPAFEVSLASDEALEVCVGRGPDPKGEPSWRLERTAGENWFRQEPMGHEGVYQGETLMAALLLVERHAPGVVHITQDDYEPGCWGQTAAWMATAVEGELNAPLGAGRHEDEDDLDGEAVDDGVRNPRGPSRS